MIAVAVPMKEVFAAIQSGEDFGYMIRDFLDRFRDEPSPFLIAEELKSRRMPTQIPAIAAQ